MDPYVVYQESTAHFQALRKGRKHKLVNEPWIIDIEAAIPLMIVEYCIQQI